MSSPETAQAANSTETVSNTVPAPVEAVPAALVSPSPLWRQPAMWLGGLALVAVAAHWLYTKQHLAALQLEAGSFNKESRQIADRNSELAQQMQTKLAVLESKFNDSQSQQLALQAMYQELSRDSDETSLADVEQALELADPLMDKADLFREAIKVFVRVQAAKRLAALGGTAK